MQTMKKALIFAGFISFAIAGRAQTGLTASGSANSPAAQASKPELLLLKETAHNFGKIPQGRPAVYTFEIVNTGKDSLKLDNVQASCGCTTPEWSRDAIAPGAIANIRVGYNAYAEGAFSK